jgi:hypothetical protein
LAFLNGLLDPQTFGRTPWVGDQSNSRSRDIGLEINAEKTKCMIMSRHPYTGQNQNIRIANESFENVAKFKY